MLTATLLFNPCSGRNPQSRLRIIESIANALRERSVEVNVVPTEGAGTAGRQASQIETDILFACGGDGTVHEILQGITFHPTVTLGVIPLGSANVLARHLGLSMDPVRAALQQLDRQAVLLPVGKVAFTTDIGETSRYFLVMAGAGPDGALVYNMLSKAKHRFGRLTYYVRSSLLFLRHRFSPFIVTTPQGTTGAVSVMAVRVADLGGLFSPLVRGASIDDSQLLVTSVAAPARFSLVSWFVMGWTRLQRWNRYVRTQRVDSFSCDRGASSTVYVQADGEWLGQTPMTVTLVPDALRLLMP